MAPTPHQRGDAGSSGSGGIPAMVTQVADRWMLTHSGLRRPSMSRRAVRMTATGSGPGKAAAHRRAPADEHR